MMSLELTGPTAELGKFRYTICLDLNEHKEVKVIAFDISRYGKYQHILQFNKVINMTEAVHQVEKYLSEPLTQEYYEHIKDDTFHKMTWEQAKQVFTCRGDCLTDCRFLERISPIPQLEGGYFLYCGS